ncbi:MAG: hypothetical protein H6711_05295 [Myxococcales bacterium]|nr:hypothetical protein [Myxococcales bacterium]
MRPILALALALSLAACSSEPKPGQREFDAASSQIASESSGKAFSGNTEAARARAELVSIAVTSLDRQLFAGQDEDKVMTRTESFMVYAQHGAEGVVFLIHVPQFKRYKDEVRETLVKAAWTAARGATADLRAKGPLRLGVGLRGSLLYGAVAVGDADGEPTIDIGGAVSTDALYPFFLGPTPPEAEVMPGAGEAAKAEEEAAPEPEAAPEEPPPAPTLQVKTLFMKDLAASLVDRTIRANDEGLQACAAGLEAGVHYDYLLAMKGNGKVTSLKPAADRDPAPEALTKCLAELAKSWTFPKKEAGQTKPESGRVRFAFQAEPMR